MEHEKIEALTQDGLIAELQNQDYSEITKRRIVDWRENDLLPPFDLIGGGHGKGWAKMQFLVRRSMDRQSGSMGMEAFTNIPEFREFIPTAVDARVRDPSPASARSSEQTVVQNHWRYRGRIQHAWRV